MDVNGAKYARLFSYIHNFRMRDKRVVSKVGHVCLFLPASYFYRSTLLHAPQSSTYE